ncbi:MAG TPA: serine hydrolase [Chitinophagaceae bacterium]|jgi:hypothetical protein|nr:serine hydrolase [Chitinophagaceae bacterium]
MKKLRLYSTLCIFWLYGCSLLKNKIPTAELTEATGTSPFLDSLLKAYPAYFDSVKGDASNIQIIYTQVDRSRSNAPILTNHLYNVNPSNYFYPASTVKLPVAALALQRLHELNIPGVNRTTPMIIGGNDSIKTTIEECIKKILLVSDNNAYNYLYDFLGQEYINNALHKMGYRDAQLLHRVSISLSEEENRLRRVVKFVDAGGKVLYEQKAARSPLLYQVRNTFLGQGFYQGDSLIQKPFDFSRKNKLTLPDLHLILTSIIFPEAISKEKRFRLEDEDYRFLRNYMSMYPSESALTKGDTAYYDAYVKFVLYGSERKPVAPQIRIFNKVGDAYGFLIDAAYVVDFKNKIEFFVSAVISCNSDGIYNDDKYEYNTVGWPFLRNLGAVLYDYELRRKRKNPPDLSRFVFDYKD